MVVANAAYLDNRTLVSVSRISGTDSLLHKSKANLSMGSQEFTQTAYHGAVVW